MGDDERSAEQIATDIRDAVSEINRLLKEAAQRDLNVELETQRVHLIEVKHEAAVVILRGVYRLVQPKPLPVPAPPPRGKRGHHP